MFAYYTLFEASCPKFRVLKVIIAPNCSLDYFKSMYCFACIGVLFLTTLGTDYAKNTRSYKHTKIKTHTKVGGIKRRTKSLFNTGLTLFHRAFESLRYVKLSFKFILYDA